MAAEYKQLKLWIDEDLNTLNLLEAWGAWLHRGLDNLGYKNTFYVPTKGTQVVPLSEEELEYINTLVTDLKIVNPDLSKVLFLRYDKHMNSRQIARALGFSKKHTALSYIEKAQALFHNWFILNFGKMAGKSEDWITNKTKNIGHDFGHWF